MLKNSSGIGMGPNKQVKAQDMFWFLYLGRNQDGVIARCGIISHQLQEEIIPKVFMHELHGNEAQTLWEHLTQLGQPTCSLNSHIILV